MQAGDWKYPYTPSARQKVLHKCTSDEVLYGGAGGGGKTDAVLAAAVTLCLAVAGAKVLILRSTFAELEGEIIPRLRDRLPDHIAQWRETKKTFTFRHNRSVIRLGQLEAKGDEYKYSGIEYQLIIWDELTRFDRNQYVFLRSRLRQGGKITAQMRRLGWTPRNIATTNPGGRGHSWVKEMFVDPSAVPDREFLSADGLTRTYIPAKVSDNPYVDQAEYVKMLSSMDDAMKRALLDGDWDILEGVRFPQFRRAKHVIPAKGFLDLPLVDYPRAVGVDYGHSMPFAAVWGALLPDNLVIVYRELSEKNLTATQQAELIRDSEDEGERSPTRPLPIALDPSSWIRPANSNDHGDDQWAPEGSVAWYYQKVFGGAVTKARNDRINGWARIDELLWVRENGLPRILIMDSCPKLIRELPSQLRGKKNPEDLEATGGDHHADLSDALRYLVMQLIGGGIRRTTSLASKAAVTQTGLLATAGF